MLIFKSALVLAGLVADGITQVRNLKYIDRGYYHLHQKLQQLGAKIDRIDVEDKIKLAVKPSKNKTNQD